MSNKYTLPQTRKVSASPLLMRHLVVWGLPFLGWVILIVVWLNFSSSDNNTQPPTETVEEQTATATQPQSLPTPSEAPVSPQSQTQTPISTPETPQPTTAQTSSNDMYAFVEYDFTSAVSQIGLAHEAACNTGILVEPATRKVLWAKGAARAVPIASMTKMMTMLLTEESIAQGRISRDTVIPVTEAAYKIGGSQVWLDPRESFPLSELLKAIAIKSANDAAFLVGEYLGNGSIDAFVQRMNTRATQLGMTHTTFYDAHGLGDSQKRNNLASAYDMVLLAERLLAYPEVMKLASTRMDTFRNGKLELKNHNNLVFNNVPGVDGLKTGYTEASGFCVTFTCIRDNRRLIGCVTGFRTHKERDTFCRALLNWGYKQSNAKAI